MIQKAKLLVRAWRYRAKLDRFEIQFVRRHLRSGNTAIDIGAHKGAYTYWMAKAVGRTGHVFSFEPQPTLYRSLIRLVAHLPATITVEPLGLSSRRGRACMVVPGSERETSPGATIEQRNEGTGRTFSIETTTLDHYFSNQVGRPIRFIKCDVEGHELEVFKGAETILKEDRPTILFECEARHRDAFGIGPVFAFLEGLGFEGCFFWQGMLRPLAEFDLRLHQRHGSKGGAYANNFIFQSSPRA